MYRLVIALLFTVASADESSSPEQLLKPHHFNPHPYDKQELLLSKFYQHLNAPQPTKQGPVLFPNDAPPPPKPPLIVTSRPLAESISRSELNPTPAPLNNSIAQPSYLNKVIQVLRPNFTPIDVQNKPNSLHLYKPVSSYSTIDNNGLNSVNYAPYTNRDYETSPYNLESYKNDAYSPIYNSIRASASPTGYSERPLLNYAPINFYKKPLIPIDGELGNQNLDVVRDYGDYDERKTEFRHPYASLLKKTMQSNREGHQYSDYEEQTVLPPIYKALADHAVQRVLKTASKPLQRSPASRHRYEVKDDDQSYNDYSNEVDNDNEDGKRYAFSYSVKDHDTGDDFSHSQRSSGAATNGEYRVRLPDGRTQIVSYTADDGGYRADVRYDESAQPDNTLGQTEAIDRGGRPHLNQEKPLPSDPRLTLKQPLDSKEYGQYDSKDYNDYGNGLRENPKRVTNFGTIVVGNDLYNGYKVTGDSATATDDAILVTPTKKPLYHFRSTPKYLHKSAQLDIGVPSTTPSVGFNLGLNSYENTDRVVHIGRSTKSPLLYTNIKSTLSNSDFSQVPSSTVAPLYGQSLYGSSTANPLYENAIVQKSRFGDLVSRFNKYLRFN